MFSLIKYEFAKKRKLFASVGITVLLANIFLSIKYGEASIPLLAVFMAIGIGILFLVDIINMYSKDINTPKGYMVFLTPNSGYKIVTAKVLTAVIEGLIALVFYALVIFINALILVGPEKIGNLRIHFIGLTLSEFIQADVIGMFAGLCYAIFFICTIFAAITLSKSLLANNKHKGFVSFGFFLLINYLSMRLVIQGVYDVINWGGNFAITDVYSLFIALLPLIISSIVLSIIMIFVIGYLLEKKINL